MFIMSDCLNQKSRVVLRGYPVSVDGTSGRANNAVTNGSARAPGLLRVSLESRTALFRAPRIAIPAFEPIPRIEPSSSKQSPWLGRLRISPCSTAAATTTTPLSMLRLLLNERLRDADSRTRYDAEFVVSRRQEGTASDGGDIELRGEITPPAGPSGEKEAGTRLSFAVI